MPDQSEALELIQQLMALQQRGQQPPAQLPGMVHPPLDPAKERLGAAIRARGPAPEPEGMGAAIEKAAPIAGAVTNEVLNLPKRFMEQAEGRRTAGMSMDESGRMSEPDDYNPGAAGLATLPLGMGTAAVGRALPIVSRGLAGAAPYGRKMNPWSPGAFGDTAMVGALAAPGAVSPAQAGDPQAGMADVPVGERGGKDWWRTKRAPMADIPRPESPPFVEPKVDPEEAKRFDAMPPGFAKLGPVGKARLASEQQGGRQKALEDKIGRARKDYELEQSTLLEDYKTKAAKAADEYKKEQERLDVEDEKYRKENLSFKESSPGTAGVMHGAGIMAAGALPYAMRTSTRGFNNRVIDKLMQTLAEAKAAKGLKAKDPAKVEAREGVEQALGPAGAGMLRPEVQHSAGRTALAYGGGAATGAEGALLPYQIDKKVLPQDSPGRREANDPMNWATTGFWGGLPALAATRFGRETPLLRQEKLAPTGDLMAIRKALGEKKPFQAPPAPAPTTAQQIKPYALGAAGAGAMGAASTDGHELYKMLQAYLSRQAQPPAPEPGP